jgi:hypothetical protein
MIAAIDDGKELHVVKWTGRVKLHAGVICYCGHEADGSHGVLQVPEAVFTHGASFNVQPGQKRAACGKCRIAAQATLT